LNTTTNKLMKAQATGTLAAGTFVFKGIALHGASLSQPLRLQNGGTITMGATVAIGQAYFLSAAAAGGVCPYADLASTNWVVFIGIGTTVTDVALSPFSPPIQKA
jgi:hypothetical protein